jgi:hypothetical protein
MNRAVVTIFPSNTNRELGEVVTKEDGRFAFSLPAGSYTLRAGTRDAQENYGSHTPSSALGSAIIAGPGKITEGLVFRWFPPGAITGRVLDDAGEPVERALVQLVRSTVLAGRAVKSTIGWFWTDDRGVYRFGRVPGGTYYVAVAGTPWYSAIAGGPVAKESPVAFLPVYYPSTTEMSGAAPIRLKPGEEFQADFSLPTARGTNLQVTLDLPPGAKGTIGLTAPGLLGNQQYFARQTLAEYSRRVSFGALPSGQYSIRATLNTQNEAFYVVQRIELFGASADITIKPLPVPPVTGRVELADPADRPRSSLGIVLVSETETGTYSTAVKADGSFFLPAVAPGRYRVSLRSADGLYASGIKTPTGEVKDGILDLTDGNPPPLTVTASGDAGELKGFVLKSDQPMEGVLAVLVPVVDRGYSTPTRGFQTESDGSYDFNHVRTGDYFLFATTDTSLEYDEPKVVKPWLERARKIHISPHGLTSENASLPEN